MAWLARLDARVGRWPLPARALYLTVKWCLVCMGAAGLCYNSVQKWGWSAGLWFLLAPLAWGVYQGLTARS